MEKYKIKTKITNIHTYQKMDYEIMYDEGILDSFYQGLAIFKGRNKYDTSFKYHIINKNFEDIFYKVFIAEKDTNVVIERDSNMNFIVSAMEKYNYRTFPGKDRETEWDLRPIILAIIDPTGNKLSKEECQAYINTYKIVPYTSINQK